MSKTKKVAKKVLAPTVEKGDTTKKYKLIGDGDFKFGLSYHVADGNGVINQIATEPKGNLSQQARAFQDASLRGGIYVKVGKKATVAKAKAKPKAKAPVVESESTDTQSGE
jgi:hypothetical protein